MAFGRPLSGRPLSGRPLAGDGLGSRSRRAGGGVGVNRDQFFSNVKLLLHGNGANGSTTIIDSSSVGNAMTANGNAQNSSTQGKFGNSIKLDGTGDYVTTTYSTSNFDWWTSDFTLEAWVYMATFTGASAVANGHEQSALIGNMDPVGVTNFWCFGPDQNSKLSFAYFNGAVQGFSSAGSISLNTWTHIAMTLSGTTIRLFINGTQDGSASVSGTPQSGAATAMALGSYNAAATINGFVDDLRLTKGVARYTASFTPTSSQFPDF